MRQTYPKLCYHFTHTTPSWVKEGSFQGFAYLSIPVYLQLLSGYCTRSHFAYGISEDVRVWLRRLPRHNHRAYLRNIFLSPKLSISLSPKTFLREQYGETGMSYLRGSAENTCANLWAMGCAHGSFRFMIAHKKNAMDGSPT